MTEASPILERPVPSLAEWLGDGKRADGFEEWLHETLALETEFGKTPDDATILRMIQTLAVAFMEVCRREHERGRSASEITHLLARAAGIAIMSPILCVCRDDAQSLHGLVKLLAKDFKHGATLQAESALRGGHFPKEPVV